MSTKSHQSWKRRNRAKKIEIIGNRQSAIAPQFVMDRFARANRDQIEERKKRMLVLKIKWRGEIPIDVLKDFDS